MEDKSELVDLVLRYSGVVVVPDLGVDEFTGSDWEAATSKSLSTSTRHLKDLVKSGVLETAERYNPETQRNCNAYWVGENAPDELKEAVRELLENKNG